MIGEEVSMENFGNNTIKRKLFSRSLERLVILILICFELLPFPKALASFDTTVTAVSAFWITEIMSANQTAVVLEDGTAPDWIEIQNRADHQLSLKGYALMLNGDPSSMCRLPDLSVPAGGYIVLYADGSAEPQGIHLSFKIPSGGAVLSILNSSAKVVETVDIPNMSRDTVWARNEKGVFEISTAATPAAANVIIPKMDETEEEQEVQPEELRTEHTGIIITEVSSRNETYAPDNGGNCWDYIELFNETDKPVKLNGWYLSDQSDKIKKWMFPDMTIEAGQYLLIYCSGTGSSDGTSGLYTNFKLSKKGTDVFLTTPGSVLADRVQVPQMEADSAWSRYLGSWSKTLMPTPGTANTFENALAMCARSSQANNLNLQINEICASANVEGADWIEIYNASSVSIDLSGFGLSDNSAKPRKWQFPDGASIPAGGYMGIVCDGRNTVSNGIYHTNYLLSKSGGYAVTLCLPDGTILDRINVPQQFDDMTFGRTEGKQGAFYFTARSPLARNDSVTCYGRIETVEYSVSPGFYKSGDVLDVELKAPEGAKIYYTLDNTDPTQSSTLYTQPIRITETTILRSRVYLDQYIESYMDTASYLYDIDVPQGVYVVSMVSDPDGLFSYERGMMVKGPGASAKFPYNGANFTKGWEREGHVEIFNADGEKLLSQGCGIQMHGQYSRAEAQQAFKVIARRQYSGTNRFPIKLFTKRDYTEYQSFVLRASGQDWDKTRMRDSILTSLAEDTSVMYQETEICVLYLDGQYWGQYNLRERINTASICQFEGWEGQEDDLDLVKANHSVMQGSNDTFAALLTYCKSADCTSDAFYQRLDATIDIQNYIEYMAIEMYTGNTDLLNVKRYRNPNADGKWRWVLFDMDWAFYTDTNSITRWLTPGGMGTNKFTDNTLFIA